MRTLASSILVAVLLAFAPAGCGPGVGAGSELVGAHCTSDQQCSGRCVINGHFPDGICTLACINDTQCPEGTACIDDAGGICAVLCTTVKTCTGFGPRYVCKNEGRHGAAGDIPVCRAD